MARCIVSDVPTVNEDLTLADVVETEQKLPNRALARSGMADDSNRCIGFNRKIKLSQDAMFAFRVLESDILKLDSAF